MRARRVGRVCVNLPAMLRNASRAGLCPNSKMNAAAQHPAPRTYKYKEVKMAQIILKTNTPEKAVDVIKEALEIEASRLKYSLNIAKKRLKSLKIMVIQN